jgi:protein-S-isoprenylcysteine O-methyltransferase Ste14
MGRRKDADRAEAIVRGVGAIVLLLLLLGVVQVFPQMLKGKSPNEMISTMMSTVMVFAVLVGFVVVLGLVVWVIVRKRRK